MAVPFLTGSILHSVDPEHKTAAISIANFAYNMFGYLPAPYIYGLVCELTGGKRSRWGLIQNFSMNLFSCLFIGLAIMQ